MITEDPNRPGMVKIGGQWISASFLAAMADAGVPLIMLADALSSTAIDDDERAQTHAVDEEAQGDE